MSKPQDDNNVPAESQAPEDQAARPEAEVAAPGGETNEAAAAPSEAARLEELERQLAEAKEQVLRALAEAENVRRRAQREVEDAGKYAITRFARDLLSVADNLGRALSSLPADKDTLDPVAKNVLIGVEATERELKAAFERHGITRIDPLGEAFNPEFHQAMMEVPSAELQPGTVAMVMIPGYMLKDRLLRPAMVGVAKAPAEGVPEGK